ncbi:hypothetical protein AB1460_36725, partial [Parafrankia sp. FMc2]
MPVATVATAEYAPRSAGSPRQRRVEQRGRDREELDHLAAFDEAYRSLPEAPSFTVVPAEVSSGSRRGYLGLQAGEETALHAGTHTGFLSVESEHVPLPARSG